MNYESFKPVKKNPEKPKSTFLQRFISKLNNSTGFNYFLYFQI